MVSGGTVGLYCSSLRVSRRVEGFEGPVHAPARSNLAAAHLKLNQPAEALAQADRAVELRPDWGKGHFRRGCALEAQGDLEQASRATA